MRRNQFCLNCRFSKGGPKLKISAGTPEIKWPLTLSCHLPMNKEMPKRQKDFWCKGWKAVPKNKA